MDKLKSNDFILRATWQLFLIFMVLKLVGYITWSWWIITLPITVPAILATILIIITSIRVRIKIRKNREELLKK